MKPQPENQKQLDALVRQHQMPAESSMSGGKAAEGRQDNADKAVLADVYPLPSAYERDLLVLMPVNPSTAYVCWEISPRTREQCRLRIKSGEPHLLMKLYTENQDENLVMESVRIEQMGSYFFRHYLPGRNCWAELLVGSESGSYLTVMVSRRVRMPDDQIHESGEFTTMTVRKNERGLLALSGFNRMISGGDGLHKTWKGVSSIENSAGRK